MSYPTLIWSGIAAQLRWEGTAEEERILYVAMTRARDQLILTGHSSHIDRDWQRWTSRLNPAQAKSYFDWVMPAALAPFGGKADADYARPGAAWQDAVWQVRIAKAVPAGTVEAGAYDGEPRLEALWRRLDRHACPVLAGRTVILAVCLSPGCPDSGQVFRIRSQAAISGTAQR